MSTNKTIRIQFEISAAMAKEMEAFEAESDMGSHREFFANIFSLWRWAANRAREGKLIAAIDQEKGKFNEITLPALETIKYKAFAERELNLASLSSGSEESQQPMPNDDLTVQSA